jgi:hypothetical protein
VGCQYHGPAVLPPGNSPVPIVKEAVWVPGMKKRKSLILTKFEHWVNNLTECHYTNYTILTPFETIRISENKY